MVAKLHFLALELVRWVAVYGLYLAGRQVAIADEDAAFRHTDAIVDVERTLHVLQEEHVQDAAAWTHCAGEFFAAYYMVGFAPVCVGALLWTAWRHRSAYTALRRRLTLALILATPFFLLYPAAPPRLAAGLGIGDSVGLSGHDTGSFMGIRFNPYAAMPSLHVGWSLLVALSLLPLVSNRFVRTLVIAHPVLMVLTVTATGNHFFLDSVMGASIALSARTLARFNPTYTWRYAMSKRIITRTGVVASIMVVAALAATASAWASFQGANGRISYGRYRYGLFDIYAVNPDGTGKRANLLGDVWVDYPGYSPEGDKLAYTIHWVASGKLRGEMGIENDDPNTNGYEGRTVVSRRWGVPWDPNFSPDASRIAFVSDRDGDWDIYVVPAAGGPKVKLTRNGSQDLQPSWSPDGRKITFAGKRRGIWHIFLMNPDGTGITRLTNSTRSDGAPSWSPDGTRIAFSRVPARGDAELYSIDVATKAVTRLTNNSTNEYSPVWSPDGARVAYERYAGGHWDIWTKPAAPGGTAVNLTRDRFVDAFPDWQPLCHLGSPRAFGPETLEGSESGELVCGGSDADILSALGGNDSVFGNDGDDSLDGGEGNDVLAGGSGVDTLVGGPGDDLINAVDGAPGDSIDAGGELGDVCYADEGDIVSGCVVQPLLGGVVAAGRPSARAHVLPARSF
jgi:hypothetical protein